MPRAPQQTDRSSRQRDADLHTRRRCEFRDEQAETAQKPALEPPPAAAAARMTTAEATVGALIAHGIDTIYALPGVHNDRAVRRAVQGRRPHPHHSHAARAGCGLSRPRRRARDRQAAGLLGGARTRVAQFVGRAAHRLRNERTGAGVGRANPAVRDRARTWTPARDSRSGGHHRPSGRFLRAHSRAGAGRRARRASATRDAHGPARSCRAGMRNRCVGPQRASYLRPRRRFRPRRTSRSTRMRSRDAAQAAGRRQTPADRRWRRRARRGGRGRPSCRACCKRRCSPIGAVAACSTAAIR